jgi:hypothetical protein
MQELRVFEGGPVELTHTNLLLDRLRVNQYDRASDQSRSSNRDRPRGAKERAKTESHGWLECIEGTYSLLLSPI